MKIDMRFATLTCAILSAFFLLGCESSETRVVAPSPDSNQSSGLPSAPVATPTATPTPTPRPSPTATPIPSTPTPVPTPRPTAAPTPSPTATPLPTPAPTATPGPAPVGDSCKTHLPGIGWMAWGTSKYLVYESQFRLSLDPIEAISGNFKYDTLKLSFNNSYKPPYGDRPVYAPVTESIEQTGLEIRATDLKTGHVSPLASNQFMEKGIRFSSGALEVRLARSAYLNLRSANFTVTRFDIYCQGELMARATQDLESLSARMQESKDALYYGLPTLYCDLQASLGGGEAGSKNGLRCAVTTGEALPTLNPTDISIFIDGQPVHRFDRTNNQQYKYQFTLSDVEEGEHSVQAIVRYRDGREEKTSLMTFLGPKGARCTPEFKSNYASECN